MLTIASRTFLNNKSRNLTSYPLRWKNNQSPSSFLSTKFAIFNVNKRFFVPPLSTIQFSDNDLATQTSITTETPKKKRPSPKKKKLEEEAELEKELEEIVSSLAPSPPLLTKTKRNKKQVDSTKLASPPPENEVKTPPVSPPSKRSKKSIDTSPPIENTQENKKIVKKANNDVKEPDITTPIPSSTPNKNNNRNRNRASNNDKNNDNENNKNIVKEPDNTPPVPSPAPNKNANRNRNRTNNNNNNDKNNNNNNNKNDNNITDNKMNDNENKNVNPDQNNVKTVNNKKRSKNQTQTQLEKPLEKTLETPLKEPLVDSSPSTVPEKNSPQKKGKRKESENKQEDNSKKEEIVKIEIKQTSKKEEKKIEIDTAQTTPPIITPTKKRGKKGIVVEIENEIAPPAPDTSSDISLDPPSPSPSPSPSLSPSPPPLRPSPPKRNRSKPKVEKKEDKKEDNEGEDKEEAQSTVTSSKGGDQENESPTSISQVPPTSEENDTENEDQKEEKESEEAGKERIMQLVELYSRRNRFVNTKPLPASRYSSLSTSTPSSSSKKKKHREKEKGEDEKEKSSLSPSSSSISSSESSTDSLPRANPLHEEMKKTLDHIVVRHKQSKYADNQPTPPSPSFDILKYNNEFNKETMTAGMKMQTPTSPPMWSSNVGQILQSISSKPLSPPPLTSPQHPPQFQPQSQPQPQQQFQSQVQSPSSGGSHVTRPSYQENNVVKVNQQQVELHRQQQSKYPHAHYAKTPRHPQHPQPRPPKPSFTSHSVDKQKEPSSPQQPPPPSQQPLSPLPSSPQSQPNTSNQTQSSSQYNVPFPQYQTTPPPPQSTFEPLSIVDVYYDSIAKNLSENIQEAYSQFKELLKHVKKVPVHIYNLMISGLLSAKNYDQADDLLSSALSSYVKLNINSFNMFISEYLRSNFLDKAMKVMWIQKEQNITLNHDFVVELISLSLKRNRYDLFTEMIQKIGEIKDFQLNNDRIQWISTYLIQQKQYERFSMFYDKMKDMKWGNFDFLPALIAAPPSSPPLIPRNLLPPPSSSSQYSPPPPSTKVSSPPPLYSSSTPPVFTASSSHSSHSSHSSFKGNEESITKFAKEERYEEVYRRLEKSIREGITPTMSTLSVAFRSLVESKDDPLLIRFLDLLSSHRIKLNHITYNSIIKHLLSKGEKERAHEVYNMMIAQDVNPDRFTFTLLLDEELKLELKNYPQLKEFSDTAFLLRVPLSQDHYRDLALLFARRGDVEYSYKIVNEMVFHNNLPDQSLYQSLVHLYIKAGNLKLASELAIQMKEANYSLDPDVERELLRAFRTLDD